MNQMSTSFYVMNRRCEIIDVSGGAAELSAIELQGRRHFVKLFFQLTNFILKSLDSFFIVFFRYDGWIALCYHNRFISVHLFHLFSLS